MFTVLEQAATNREIAVVGECKNYTKQLYNFCASPLCVIISCVCFPLQQQYQFLLVEWCQPSVQLLSLVSLCGVL